MTISGEMDRIRARDFAKCIEACASLSGTHPELFVTPRELAAVLVEAVIKRAGSATAAHAALEAFHDGFVVAWDRELPELFARMLDDEFPEGTTCVDAHDAAEIAAQLEDAQAERAAVKGSG